MLAYAVDTPLQGFSERYLAQTNAIKQELWTHHSFLKTGGHTRIYSYTQLQSVFDRMEDGGIEHIRLAPWRAYKILYQEPGIHPHYNGFTTRTLWNGSPALFTQHTDWGISFTPLLDRSTNFEDGKYELTVWCNFLFRHEIEGMAISYNYRRHIYSIGPFGKSVAMLTHNHPDGFKGFLVVDIQGVGGNVTERTVRVDFGVNWKPACMDFDDARGILTFVTWEGLIFHIHLV
jgi:hypothetical protein